MVYSITVEWQFSDSEIDFNNGIFTAWKINSREHDLDATCDWWIYFWNLFRSWYTIYCLFKSENHWSMSRIRGCTKTTELIIRLRPMSGFTLEKLSFTPSTRNGLQGNYVNQLYQACLQWISQFIFHDGFIIRRRIHFIGFVFYLQTSGKIRGGVGTNQRRIGAYRGPVSPFEFCQEGTGKCAHIWVASPCQHCS